MKSGTWPNKTAPLRTDMPGSSGTINFFVNTPALIDTKIEHDYKTMGGYQRSMTINIFACDKEDPKYVDEVGCTKIGQVEVNIPSPSVDERNVGIKQKCIRIAYLYSKCTDCRIN
jgi:hypothetical protein